MISYYMIPYYDYIIICYSMLCYSILYCIVYQMLVQMSRDRPRRLILLALLDGTANRERFAVLFSFLPPPPPRPSSSFLLLLVPPPRPPALPLTGIR